jgi:hypothetical protein
MILGQQSNNLTDVDIYTSRFCCRWSLKFYQEKITETHHREQHQILHMAVMSSPTRTSEGTNELSQKKKKGRNSFSHVQISLQHLGQMHGLVHERHI